jgi:DNA sulfur modification protein DndD
VLDRQGNDIRSTSLLNHTAKRDDDYKFTVQIHFEHEGEQWNILRSTKANRHQDKKYEDGMTIEVYKNGRIVSDPEHQIQRILPSTVSRFYFFDGEMLRDYEELLEGDVRAIAMLKDSIERVLGVPFFKTARSDLDMVKKKFEKERARIMRQLGGSDFEELAEFQQELEKDLEDIEKSIAALEEQKEKLEAIIAEDKRKLADMKDVQEKAQERLRVEEELEKWKAKKETKELERGNLVEKIYKNVLSPIAQNLIQQLEIKSKQALEKYDKKQRLTEKAESLKKGISKSKCSQCGHVLDPKKLKDFKRELKEAMVLIEELTDIPEPNLSYENSKAALEKMMESVISAEDIKKIDDKIIEYEYEIQRLNSELERIQAQLEGVDADEPRNLEIKIRQNEKESGRLSGIVEEKTNEKLGLLKDKNELDTRIASIPQKELTKLNNKIIFIEQLKNTFDEAVSKFREEQKERVESTATNIFKKIRSKKEFDCLSINDQYGLNIITKDGTILNRSEWRSSGEEQLVALSLIGALNQCAKAEGPIFMDTPFGRLDILHGERVLKFLPNMSKQLVLLVTDREFREGDQAHLKGNIKTDLTLKYKSEKEGSIILPTTGVS